MPAQALLNLVSPLFLFVVVSLKKYLHSPGARGVTLTFSSGDFGVGDGDANPATQQCFTNDGRNATKFIPTFPAT